MKLGWREGSLKAIYHEVNKAEVAFPLSVEKLKGWCSGKNTKVFGWESEE